MFLRKRDSIVDDYSCRTFVEGCPNTTYRIYEAYKCKYTVAIISLKTSQWIESCKINIKVDRHT